MITIKPHHFMDIIKLYGKGITVFVPDTNMGHDFYAVANEILAKKQTILKLTTEGDDICKPCRFYKTQCTDPLTTIPGYTSKNTYNTTLDERMMQFFHLNTQKTYSSQELCSIYFAHHDFIFQIWKEENDAVTKARHDWFVKGAKKYLQ